MKENVDKGLAQRGDDVAEISLQKNWSEFTPELPGWTE